MTADEIRSLNDRQQELYPIKPRTEHKLGDAFTVLTCGWLAEIAAQLAELNDTLTQMANPPVFYNPELITDDEAKRIIAQRRNK